MCIIQVFSDLDDSGEFEYLDEDIWLEKNGCYLLNLHMILKVKTNLSNISLVLHGNLEEPKNSIFYSSSWNIKEKTVLFNNSFISDTIRENYYHLRVRLTLPW